MESLAAYLAAQNMSCAEFARRLGVPDSTVLRWSKGERTPTVVWAFAVEKETGGAVPASSWQPTRRGARRVVRGSPRRSGKRAPQSS